MKSLIGKKLGMTQVFNGKGDCIPVTLIRVDRCVPVLEKTPERDGYQGVLIAYGDRKDKHTNKPLKGFYEKHKIAPAKLLAEFRDEFWDLTLEVNLTVPYLLSKAALPSMREQGWGRIITVASINGRVTLVHTGAYTASKHGVLGLMRTLALEHAAEGITVNCICPGPVQTRMNDLRMQYDAQRLGRSFEEHENQVTPIGGRLEPEDIAPMAVYLASDEARMITGQAYNIDGGICMA